MLTRLSPEAVRSPQALEQFEREAMEQAREMASKVSILIRTFGDAQTEVWPATEWNRFKEIVRTL